MKGFSSIVLLAALVIPSRVEAFSLPSTTTRSATTFAAQNVPSHIRRTARQSQQKLFMGEDPSQMSEEPNCWNPRLRRIVGSMASLGALETAYLTYAKLNGGVEALCGPDGGCNSVLTSSYASIPFTDIPLASLGFLAYSTVGVLALLPLIASPSSSEEANDTGNRIWLTSATTVMGTFSVFLVSLLFQVLHASCPFCILSAFLSIGMAGIVWIGGGLPEEARKGGMQGITGSFVTTVLAALVLFFSVDDNVATQFAGSPRGESSSASQRLLAAANKPPEITSMSSERTLALSKKLQELDATLYGAFWCSHCYDQKEAFGKEAFSKIAYVECSKDGYNQQNALCKEKNVPGYPTWSIAGNLYPGEQALEELEEIVQAAKK